MRTTQAPMYSCGGRRPGVGPQGSKPQGPPNAPHSLQGGEKLNRDSTPAQQHTYMSSDMQEALRAGAPGDNVCTRFWGPPPAICAGLTRQPPQLAYTGLTARFRHTLITVEHTALLATGAHLRCTSRWAGMGKRRLWPDTGREAGAGRTGGLGACPVCTHELRSHPLFLPSRPCLALALAPHPYQKPLSWGPGVGGWVDLPYGLLAIC